MHILGIILGLLVTGYVWYRRLKIAAQAGGKAVDAAQRVRGKVRRRRSRDAAAFAPVSAIDDPVVAAATLLRFVAGDERWGARRAAARAALAGIADAARADDAVAYAEWAARQVEHERRSIDALAAKLAEWLDAPERARLAAMIDSVAGEDADGRARADRARDRIRVIGRPGRSSTEPPL